MKNISKCVCLKKGRRQSFRLILSEITPELLRNKKVLYIVRTANNPSECLSKLKELFLSKFKRYNEVFIGDPEEMINLMITSMMHM
jgi:hypothetical protein